MSTLGPSPPIMIDSGSTGHYVHHHHALRNITPTDHPIRVQVANQHYMTSTHTAELPIDGLPHEARQAHIFPDIHTSLLAVAPLCDQGCTVLFENTGCTITLPNGNKITGPRNDQGLWILPQQDQLATHAEQASHTATFPASTEDQLAAPVMNRHTNTPADLVAFAHAALFSPAISTLRTALCKGFLPPFPGLNEQTLAQFPPALDATAMGHLDAQRRNTRSTKTTQQDNTDQQADCFPPQSEQPGQRTHACFIATTEPRNVVYTDQTGRLPHPSSAGNNYLVVAYDYDSNNILMRPIKNRSAQAINTAIADIHQTLTRGGCRPQFHRLDNECSHELKQWFADNNIQYQLAPPHEHRSNAAERAIRTAKNHLAAGWWSTDPNFPMHLWDKTIPQAELTLNLLRHSRLNPKLSAWEQLHGRFDFNRTPIAPPGIRVKAHARPSQRQTWAPHTFDAWYIGPALEHYRCYTVWATQLRQVRIVNQLMWFPTNAFPKLDNLDLLRAAVKDAIVVLRSPPTETFASTLESNHRTQLINFFDTIQQQHPPIGHKKGAEPDTSSLGVPE